MADLAQYDPIFKEAGDEWDVDPLVLKALVSHESGGDPRARGKSGEVGLGQIMPGTQRHLGVTDPTDPAQSIFGAAKYLNEALTAERDNPTAALRYYNAGPGWRSARNRDPNYPSYVFGQYKKYAKADTGTKTDASPAPAASEPVSAPASAPAGVPLSADEQWMLQQAERDPKYTSLQRPAWDAAAPAKPAPASGGQAVPASPPAATTSPAKADPDDDPFSAALKADTGAKADAADPFTAAMGKPGQEPAAEPPRGGMVRNTAAGVVEGATGAANVLTDPFGNLIGRPLATGLIFAHDALAPVFGYERFPDKTRNALLGDTVPQPATRAINALADATGTTRPEDVPANTPAEQLVRKAAAGATAVATLGPGGIVAPALVGAGGAVAGDLAAQAAPEWAKPAAELAGNVVGGAAAIPALVGVRAGGNALAAGVNRFGNGPAGPPSAPRLSPMEQRVADVRAANSGNPLPFGPDGRPPTAEAQAAAAYANQPRSAGSAASREGTPASQIEMAPADMKANRRQAEMADLHEPSKPDDLQLYVKGSHPTLAESSGHPLTSQQETLLRQRNPEAFERRLSENNAARVADFEDFTPSHTEVRSIERERSIQAQADNDAIMQHAKPADAQPALDVLDSVLNNKRNANRDSVQDNLGPYRKRLFDADGKLKTDVQELWGIRDDLTEKMNKIGNDPSSTMGFVKKETEAFRDAIDGVLNKATGDNYQTFLDNYAAHSQKINEGKLLGEFRDKSLTDAKGNINANRFHKFVVDIAHERGERGIHPENDITDATMARLIALDRDLKRTGQIDLGKARGSGTDLFGTLAKGMGLAGAHAVTALAAPGIGNLVLQGAVSHGVPIIGKMRLNYLTNKHLREPPGGYHPLIDPNAPP